jgi:DNA-binding transcriptional ArsR family regulator
MAQVYDEAIAQIMMKRGTPSTSGALHPEQVAVGRAWLLEERTYTDLAALYSALGDPTRVRIVHSLLRQELCTTDLAAVAGVSESAVSQHLRVLRGLRLVKTRRAGKLVYHSLDDEHVAQLLEVGLTHLGHDAAVLEGRSPS